MNKLILMILTVCALASAQLVTENFSYSTGQLDAVNAGANVSGGNWVNFSGTTNVINVSTGNLSFSGYSLSGVGNKITIVTGSAEDAYRAFTTQLSGKVYFSLLVNITSATGLIANSSTTGDYSFALLPSTSTTALNARVSVRTGSVAGTYNYGLRASSSNTASTFKATDYSTGTTHLIVVSYEIVVGAANDIVKMWIDPTLGGSEPAADLTQTAALDLSDVARIAIRQGTNSVNAEVDGISVGTTWSDTGLPVEISSFSAIAKSSSVELAWKTATEVNNKGFEIERAETGGEWTKVGYVVGAGNSNVSKSYSFTDANARGTVSYRLKQIDNDGNFKYAGLVEATAPLTAADFELSQNYPNPFNPNTNITFAMKNAERVNVSVYNALGQVVATLFNDVASANQLYTLNFDGKNLASGTYFYALRSASRNEVRKMSLMK